ncbi:MAG: small multi-drug export protein [Candidatus Aenigmatarchaeota archaeon]|nr:small multi-drug export protein [Candidatus Aenigmarchaeota archaeon]
MQNILNETIAIIILSVMPISELRGSIPLGLQLGLNPIFVFLISIIFNALVFFPIYFGLELFYHRFFYRFKFVNKCLERISKHKDKIDKYGFFGLVILVAIPLPFTGAWTGSGLSWLLRLEWKKSFFAIFIGVLIAGIVVLLISLSILKIF